MKNETSINIPKKYEPMLDEVTKDFDGYWAYSKDGFYFPPMGCHTAHEDTQSELLKVIRTLEPCDCDECKKALSKESQMANIGQILYGFCDGYFGRDSYGDKIVEGIGSNWIVAREEGKKYVVLAQFEDKQERNKCLALWSNKPNEYGDYE